MADFDPMTLKRAVLNTPHPMYGALPPGFGVGDLPASYQEGTKVFDAITGNQTSAAINIAANGIELAADFTDLHTSCDIKVYKADGTTLITTFAGVDALHADGLYAGFAELNDTLGGGALVFKTANFSGTGKLTLTVRRTG